MPLQLQGESLSFSVRCMHNQRSYHFKVRPTTVLNRVYRALLLELAQEVPCVVRDMSDMQLLCYGNVLTRFLSVYENNILSGDEVDMFLSQKGD